MRPDAKRKLDRLLWDRRIKLLRVPGTILAGILLAFALWHLDYWTTGDLIEAIVLTPPVIDGRSDIIDYSFTARLDSGKSIIVESEIRAAVRKGNRIFLQEEVSRILRRKRYRLVRIEPASGN